MAPTRSARPRAPRRALALAAGAAGLAALLAGCGDGDGRVVAGVPTRATDPSTEPTTDGTEEASAEARELAEARRTWDGAGIDDYAVTVSRSCFCAPYSATWRVTVQDGVVVGVDAIDPVDAPLDQALPTVDELFAAIGRVVADDGAELNAVAYDVELGYPTHAALDRIVDAVDDEISWRMSDLQPLEDPVGGDDVDAAAARWQAAGVEAYSAVVDVTCGECVDPTTIPIRLRVEDGAVVDVRWAEPTDSDVLPPEPADVAHLTVEALLGRIADDPPASVSFDPLDGHPVEVRWDEPEVLDDEVAVVLTDLVVIA